MSGSELTVIIPFKNEKEEVLATVNSIIAAAENSIDIILINDGSDDGYDYSVLENVNNLKYIHHETSWGVAASREHGVSLAETEYFLLLDAHMRSHTLHWDTLLLRELKKDPNALFCCLTTELDGTGFRGYGVTVDWTTLAPTWNLTDSSPDDTVSIVPCLMGASYCTNVKFWKRIKGVEGLKSYGFDEQFMCLKTNLSGGKCKVIKSVEFGHKFRVIESVPYTIHHKEYIYNALLIIELLYPLEQKVKTFISLRSQFPRDDFNNAIDLIKHNRNRIKEYKEYLITILKYDLVEFVNKAGICNINNVLN